MSDPDRPLTMMNQLQVILHSTGRPVMLALPTDLTDSELLELIGWLGGPDGFRATTKPKSSLTIARGVLA